MVAVYTEQAVTQAYPGHTTTTKDPNPSLFTAAKGKRKSLEQQFSKCVSMRDASVPKTPSILLRLKSH